MRWQMPATPAGFWPRLLFVGVLALMFYGDPILRPPDYHYCWSRTAGVLFVTPVITVPYENVGPEARHILAAPLAAVGFADPACSAGSPDRETMGKSQRMRLRSPGSHPLPWQGVGLPPAPAEVLAGTAAPPISDRDGSGQED